MKIHRLFLFALTISALAAGPSSDDTYQAIRANDMNHLRRLIAQGDVNAKDRRGATPLMYAASVGSIQAVKLLLAAGADAKAANALNATALMWGIGNLEKVRLLVDAGADVNARSKQGMTPLLIAASNSGSIEIVRLLLAKGADPMAKTEGGFTALLAAAFANDLDMVRLFVEKGVGVNQATRGGETALQAAAINVNLDMVRFLLAKGANANAANTEAVQVRKGPVELNHLSPLLLAAPYGSPELLLTLIDAGADLHARDVRNMTPLMLAVASETQNPEVVRVLLERGADVKAKSLLGETALDWAKKFGNPSVERMLHEDHPAEAPPASSIPPASPVSARTAVEKSVALLQNSSTEFFKESACVGCHHQNLTAMAVGAARRKGVRVDEAAAEEQLKVVKTLWAGAREALLQRLDPPGGSDTVSYSLLGLAALDYPPDAMTDAMAINVAYAQLPEGGWLCGGNSRAPIQESCISAAARGIRVLQLYGPPGLKPEFEKRIARARAFLLEARPKTTDDHAMLLLGLKWSGLSKEKTREAAQKLLGRQRPDGGWAGNPNLTSDAYATGEALYALYESGALAPGAAEYRSATDFLLKTQRQDGSWYVKSRAVKFQPYFQSGFPYDHDQWISAAGTGWAAIALANGITNEPRAAQ
jgi:ankyrin repeat protein